MRKEKKHVKKQTKIRHINIMEIKGVGKVTVLFSRLLEYC